MAFFSRVKILAGFGDQGEEASKPYSLVAANTTNATLIKDQPGVITAIHAINVNAGVRYLKFYDTSRVPIAGSGTPGRRYAIPASATGAGFVFAPATPLKFYNGIAFTLVTGAADSDATAPSANDVILTIEWI